MRGIAIREDLTEEWKQRGIREQKDFEILTAEMQATLMLLQATQKVKKSQKREFA